MKRALLILLLILAGGTIYSQTTYYWVGGVASANSISVGSNWNTSLDGGGGTRPSATGASDILVFDGTNVGGTSPISDTVTVLANASITCAQMKFVNNAWVKMIRATSMGGGTSTITINGEAGDDFVVDASSGVIFNSDNGSIRMQMVKTASITTTGRINGTMKTISPLQIRFDNTTAGLPGTFVFTSGSKLFTNITSASSSYAFGNNTQSSEKWVVFEAGSHLYFDGGFSPSGSGAGYSAIDMRPGSVWHHRATNLTSGRGNFFVNKNFGDVIIENGATLVAMGSIYGIGNLTVNTGSTFNLYDQGGRTAVTGNLVVDGTLTTTAGNHELIIAGSGPQTITGTGTINVPGLIIADNANVTLSKDVIISNAASVYGKINFGTRNLSGAGTFRANGKTAPFSATANLFVDSFFIKGNVGIPTNSRGLSISGTGIPANTSIVAFSGTGDTVYLSNPVTTTGTGVALTVWSDGAILETANSNGFDPATGSVSLAGNQTYQDNINYSINAATTFPFGVSTASSPGEIHADFVEVNAPVTFNRSVTIADHLSVNGKITLNPQGSIHILSTGVINGAVGASNYIVTTVNTTNGDQSLLQVDGVNAARLFPVGSATSYLPVTLTPTATSDFAVTAFEGITENGAPNGTAFTPTQKLTVVDAVWDINRIAGTGDADMQINWPGGLEGATFTTLPGTDIGLIRNNGTTWTLPGGIGDNAANTATGTISVFGVFSAGAVPQVDPFVYNPLPTRTYGEPDFSGGATSLNTTQPIIYSSDNLAVATIVSGNIHIVGAGTAVITAAQATDGVYPAVSVPQTLTVDKADLEIKADDQLKFEGLANPVLTATYTGFVLGETPAALLTPAVITTTAVTASPPGTYPITVSGATSDNYDITFVDGLLTVQPKQAQTITFDAIAAKNYGAGDFSTGATSTNTTIPITYTSSNTNVATVNSAGTVHITGAGTTTVTASQAGNDGYFAATPVQQDLVVNKVPLTVRVRDTSKVEFTPNPEFTITYTGFVLGETPASLTTQPVANTSATTSSVAGNYAVTPENGVSQNYNFNYVAGRLTILPAGGTDKQTLIAFQNSNGNLTVRVYSTFPTLGDIIVFDMSGRPVAWRNIFMPEGFAQVEVFIPKASSGIHIVKLKGRGINLEKLVSIIK